jgi:hypothetical protein
MHHRDAALTLKESTHTPVVYSMQEPVFNLQQLWSSQSPCTHLSCPVPAACSYCTDKACSRSWSVAKTVNAYSALAMLVNYPEFQAGRPGR